MKSIINYLNMLTLKEIILLKINYPSFNLEYNNYKLKYPLLFTMDLNERITEILNKYDSDKENTITYDSDDDDYYNPIYKPIYFSFNNLRKYPLQIICRKSIPYSVDLVIRMLDLSATNLLLIKGFKAILSKSFELVAREDGPYLPYKMNWKHTKFYPTKYGNIYKIEDFYRKK